MNAPNLERIASTRNSPHGGRTHGRIATYNNAGCRCADCTEAARRKQARYRAHKRAARHSAGMNGGER